MISNRGWVWISRLLRWGLAAIFAFAAVLKATDPYRFAQDIRNYHIMPWWSLNAVALLLPWIELVCAAALVVNRWSEESAVIFIVMLFVYIFALGSTIVRGIDIECGCFGKFDKSSAGVAIVRDMVFLTMATGLLAIRRWKLRQPAAAASEVQ
jgi:hypothetical protein